MSKRLTNYTNKILNEVNITYSDVISPEKARKRNISYVYDRRINYESRLNSVKRLKYFVGDILRIEDIIMRRPIEGDEYDKNGELYIPFCVYECVIVKSIRENKYYALNIDFLTIKDIEYIINSPRNSIYIYDITNHLHTLKRNEDIEDDVDYMECYKLLNNSYQDAKSIYDENNNYYI